MRLIVVILSFIIVSAIFAQSTDTLYPVKVYTQDGYKYGYINNQGYLSIKPQFAFAKDFSEGLAFVKNDNNTSKWLCINTSGIVEFDLTAVYVKEFSNSLAKFVDSAEGRYTINRSGRIIYDPPVDPPVKITSSRPYFKDGKYGYINYETNETLPPIYYKAGHFSEGFAPVFIMFKDSDVPEDNCYNAFINEKGDVVIKTELKYDEKGHLESGYFYSPEKWVNGVCRYYETNDPKTRVEKYIRNDGVIIW